MILFFQEIVKHQYLLHGELLAIFWCDPITVLPALEVAFAGMLTGKTGFFFSIDGTY